MFAEPAKRVDDDRCCTCRSRDPRHVLPDEVTKAIARALDGSATEQPNAAFVPVSGTQSVDRHVIRIAKTVSSVADDLFET